jgi:transposase-like protein
MRARRNPEQWSALLDELSESGESVDSFCRRRGVRPGTLYWWRWKLGAARRKSSTGTGVRLLPVAISSSAAPVAGAVVIHVSDLRMHVEAGTDVAYVAALVEALRSRC